MGCACGYVGCKKAGAGSGLLYETCEIMLMPMPATPRAVIFSTP